MKGKVLQRPADPTYICMYICSTQVRTNQISFLPLGVRHHGPLAAPRPLAGAAVAAAALRGAQLLVRAGLQPHHHVRLARAQRQHVDAGPRAQGADRLRERRRGIPGRLSFLQGLSSPVVSVCRVALSEDASIRNHKGHGTFTTGRREGRDSHRLLACGSSDRP